MKSENMNSVGAENQGRHRVGRIMVEVFSSRQGSILVLTLLILAILTLGGIIAANRSSTGSVLVRNTAIHKQNMFLAELAAMEGISHLLNPLDAPPGSGNFVPVVNHVEELHWFHDKTAWDDNPANAVAGDVGSYPLDDNNSVIPWLSLDTGEGGVEILDQRGEVVRDGNGQVIDFLNNASMRYYAVGWDHISSAAGGGGGGSMVDRPGGVMQQCRIVGEYNSPAYGRKTVEIGVAMLREVE